MVIGLVAAAIMAHFIYFTERRHNPDFQHGYVRGIWEAVWWLLTIVANGEYPDRPTRSTARRLMTIAFWLVGLLLVAPVSYTHLDVYKRQGQRGHRRYWGCRPG